MELIKFIKKIRYRFSRDHCYEQMKRSGYAFLNCCGGVAGGDKYTDYLSYDCVDCPYYIPGFSADAKESQSQRSRKKSIL